MILIVDDEPHVRLAMGRILQRQGYKVMEAADGWEALDLLANERFNLVITDLKMPDLDGTALTAQIHNHWPAIPVLLISGADPTEPTKKLISERSLKFLRKPIERDALITSVRCLISATAHGPHGP